MDRRRNNNKFFQFVRVERDKLKYAAQQGNILAKKKLEDITRKGGYNQFISEMSHLYRNQYGTKKQVKQKVNVEDNDKRGFLREYQKKYEQLRVEYFPKIYDDKWLMEKCPKKIYRLIVKKR